MTTTWPPADRHRDETDPHAWTAPLTATLLLVPLAPSALVLGELSPMATDSCGPEDCAVLIRSLDTITTTLSFGVPLTLVALITAWTLPRTRRWTAWRAWAAVGALLPSLTVLFLVLTLPGS
jgi:hypothetical protein